MLSDHFKYFLCQKFEHFFVLSIIILKNSEESKKVLYRSMEKQKTMLLLLRKRISRVYCRIIFFRRQVLQLY